MKDEEEDNIIPSDDENNEPLENNNENDFDEAIMIAEILANTNNENTLQSMQQNIKNQYQIFDSIQKKQAMAFSNWTMD